MTDEFPGLVNGEMQFRLEKGVITPDLPCGCATMCNTCRRELQRHSLPLPPPVRIEPPPLPRPRKLFSPLENARAALKLLRRGHWR